MQSTGRAVRIIGLLRESCAAALGTKITSAVSIVMVAGMVLAVLLTAGRTVGAQQEVIDTLDDAGTRTIVVRAGDDAGLDPSVLTRVQGITAIAGSAAFGPAQDAINAAVPEGTRVPIRMVFGDDLSILGLTLSGFPGGAYASDIALSALGLEHPAGAVKTIDGIEVPISGRISTPEHLTFLEPLLIVPYTPETTDKDGSDIRFDSHRHVATLVVLAQDASQVSVLTDVVKSLLDVADPQSVTVESSEQLAHLRGLIDTQLGSANRALVIAIFALTAVLVASILYALVLMRRKDYGRRRALGATRSFIMALVLTQVASLAVIGAALGAAVASGALMLSESPQPPLDYYLSIALLAIATAVVAGVLPAGLAATRDPAKELRVP